MTAEVEPHVGMWLALACLLRDDESDATDRAIAHAIDAVTGNL